MDHQALLYLKESLYSLPLKQLLLNFHDIFQHTVASNGNVRRSYKEHLRKISLATENGRSQKGGSLPTAIQGAMLNFRAVGHQSKPSMSIVHATRGCAFTSRHVWMTQTLQQIEVSRLSIMSQNLFFVPSENPTWNIQLSTNLLVTFDIHKGRVPRLTQVVQL